MFEKWGRFSYAHRRLIPAIVVAAILALFIGFGLQLEDRMSQEGWEDPNAASTSAAQIEEETFGRDNSGDVILLFHSPDENFDAAKQHLAQLKAEYPEQIDSVTSYFDTKNPNLVNDDHSLAFAAIGLKGDDEQTLKDFRTIQGALTDTSAPVEIAGATAVADALDNGMSHDISRAEKAALPLVGILLLVVFGSVVAACMPLIVGGLSILGSLGILSILAGFSQVNVFAQAVVTLLGLGLAIDYGLFMVSRFREELDKGRSTEEAVATTTATAGQTVVFSAAMVAVALSGLFLFPQAFLKFWHARPQDRYLVCAPHLSDGAHHRRHLVVQAAALGNAPCPRVDHCRVRPAYRTYPAHHEYHLRRHQRVLLTAQPGNPCGAG